MKKHKSEKIRKTDKNKKFQSFKTFSGDDTYKGRLDDEGVCSPFKLYLCEIKC